MVHLGGRNTSFLWGHIPRPVELPLEGKMMIMMKVGEDKF
jgi:hypothetical protein